MQNTIKKSRTLFIIPLWLMISFLPAARAQNKSNSITVMSSNTSYTLSSASMLEAVQTISGSISMAVDSKSAGCSVYAMVSASSTTSSTPMPASMLALQLSSIAPPRSANFSTIPLSQSNQLLFQSTSSFNQENLVYNLLLGPVGYSYKPGTYSFTILFTMTQP